MPKYKNVEKMLLVYAILQKPVRDPGSAQEKGLEPGKEKIKFYLALS